MKLESVELLHVRRRLDKPFRISVGAISAREFIVLRGYGEGFTVYSEVNIDARPFYTQEFVVGAWDILKRDLIPLVLQREFHSATEVAACYHHVRGHEFAKAAVEGLFWDLEGKIKGKSLCQLLGGEARRLKIGTSHSIFPTVQQLVEDVRQVVEQGIMRIKIKIMPGWDYLPLLALREEFPDILLMGDANAAYTEEHIPVLQRLDECNLCMLEQPFAHYDLCTSAKLRQLSRTPICWDESLLDLDLIHAGRAMQAVDIGNIKVGRVGGLAYSCRIAEYAAQHDFPLWVGRRTGSGITVASELALSSRREFVYPTDHGIDLLHESRDHFVDMAQFDYHSDGTLAVPSGPGLGVEVDEAMLRSRTLASEAIQATSL